MKEEISLLNTSLYNLSESFRSIYSCLTQLKNEQANISMIERSESFIMNEKNRIERIKSVFSNFSTESSAVCKKYMDEMNSIQKEEYAEFEELQRDIGAETSEMMIKMEMINDNIVPSDHEPHFKYRNGKVSNNLKLNVVRQYPGSKFYKEYIRSSTHGKEDEDILIDHDGDNEDLIIKYMRDDPSLTNDIQDMSIESRKTILEDIEWFELPLKTQYITQLCYSQENKLVDAFLSRKVIMVNGKNAQSFNQLMKKNHIFDKAFENQKLCNIHYFQKSNIVYVNLNLEYYDLIENYLKNGKKVVSKELAKKYRNISPDGFINELQMIGVELQENELKEIKKYFYQPLIMGQSTILDDNEYDKTLKKWIGNEYDWKLLYRASEHEYTAESFHKCCDDKGPTVVIIKSTGGWIFGGYTTQSWSGDSMLSTTSFISR